MSLYNLSYKYHAKSNGHVSRDESVLIKQSVTVRCCCMLLITAVSILAPRIWFVWSIGWLYRESASSSRTPHI